MTFKNFQIQSESEKKYPLEKYPNSSQNTINQTITDQNSNQEKSISDRNCLSLKNSFDVVGLNKPKVVECSTIKYTSKIPDYTSSDQRDVLSQKISATESNISSQYASKQTDVSKWSLEKYNRSERQRRKREQAHENQPLITSFFPIIEKMSTSISSLFRSNPELVSSSYKTFIQGSNSRTSDVPEDVPESDVIVVPTSNIGFF